jgi:protein arginine kinase activator
MICQQCQKRLATLQIVQNIDGRQLEIFLCEQCASNNEKVVFKVPSGLGGGIHINLNDLLPGLMSFGSHGINVQKELACSFCGNTFSDFQKLGKMGCGNCYEVFHSEITPIISRIQGNLEYKGKMPGEKGESNVDIGKIFLLKKDLNLHSRNIITM